MKCVCAHHLDQCSADEIERAAQQLAAAGQRKLRQAEINIPVILSILQDDSRSIFWLLDWYHLVIISVLPEYRALMISEVHIVTLHGTTLAQGLRSGGCVKSTAAEVSGRMEENGMGG